MKIYLITDNYYQENCYIIKEEDLCTIIDPGFNFDKIMELLLNNNLKLDKIILTHGHIDHTGDMDKLLNKYPDTKIYISEFDSNLLFDSTLNCSSDFGMPKIYKENYNYIIVKDKDEIDGYKFYLTPGHTKGSMIVKKNNFLFTGDTLFKGTIGRTDLKTGSIGDMDKSLEFIKKSFPKEIVILSGHGIKTTLKDEIKMNPYLRKRK